MDESLQVYVPHAHKASIQLAEWRGKTNNPLQLVATLEKNALIATLPVTLALRLIDTTMVAILLGLIEWLLWRR